MLKSLRTAGNIPPAAKAALTELNLRRGEAARPFRSQTTAKVRTRANAKTKAKAKAKAKAKCGGSSLRSE
jgi:hypothetical protein